MFHQTLEYLSSVPNTSCNRYCNNTFEHTDAQHQFQCGSLTDPSIWAIYDLRSACPSDFTYVTEIKKFIYSHSISLRFCNSSIIKMPKYIVIIIEYIIGLL
ncbi:unnamed protein product [Adineta steineri]|uniref:Uncharacterized protein n=1 Tax=Adineta steineri TaxID=433720 RepID=A0A820KM75_9BILA|nr:unnamed protein product [Adineta steineri]